MAEISLRVVDLYHADRVASFQAAAAFGIWGVIHKATTGETGRDPAYADRRTKAIAAGLLWGAYHWGTSLPVANQVENFLRAADPDDTTLVALDYETSPGNQMTLEQAREFLGLLGQRLGRKPVLYSGHLIKQDLGETADPFFGAHRLWLAQYSASPMVQKSWQTYWLWQYADNRNGLEPNEVPGIPGDPNGNWTAIPTSGQERSSRHSGLRERRHRDVELRRARGNGRAASHDRPAQPSFPEHPLHRPGP